jgi:hypothetical protein
MSFRDYLRKRFRALNCRPGSPLHVGSSVGFCIVLAALAMQLDLDSKWSVVENTADGIQIMRREAGDTSLVAFRGIGVIEAPLPLVASIIFDTDRRLEWIAGLSESKILRWRSKDTYIEYDHIDMPIFIRDRDFVSKVTMTFDPSKREMTFHYQATIDPSAPHTRHIHGNLINATFILSSLENDRKTRVDAEFLCDPKGMIPKWLVNFFMKDWPKTTFRNLRKEVLKPDISVNPRFSDPFKRGTTERE